MSHNMEKLKAHMIDALTKPLPSWAVKQHPTKQNMSAIHPMAVIDRLNEVFGLGSWHYEVEYIACNPFIQNTKNGPRDMFMSAVKGTLKVEDYNICIQQFGGSQNDDMGDALKGGGTDALTKIASYLGIGAEIYKGKGNTDPNVPSPAPSPHRHTSLATNDQPSPAPIRR